TTDVTCVAFTGDGRRLVSGDKNQHVKLWDVTHSPEARAFRGGTHGFGEWLANLVFAAEGQTLCVASLDKNEPRPRVRRFDVEGTLVADRPLPGLGVWTTPTGNDVHFSADGRRLASSLWAEPGAVRVCDAASGTAICTVRTGWPNAR